MFMSTNLKNNQFQKKLIAQNISPTQLHNADYALPANDYDL